MEKPSTNSIDHPSDNLLLPIKGGVIVDIGTGDGTFVYQSAFKNPDCYYIGIDSSTDNLEKTSGKIYRKPAKGGLTNALFVQAAVENLPSELNGIADEIHIHFPWGSLLGALAIVDEPIIKSLRKMSNDDALLEILIAPDQIKDRSEFMRLGIKSFTEKYIDSILSNKYKSCGFELREHGQFLPAQWPLLCSSWAQKLRDGTRNLIYLIFQAIPHNY